MSETMTFTPPVSVAEKTTANGNTYWTLEDAEGRQASTWSRAVAEHLRQATGVTTCEVELRERDGKRYRNVVAIPGVVKRAQRQAPRGSALSDRQAAVIAGAILAASGTISLSDAATTCLAWLTGGAAPSPAAGDRPAAGDTSPTDLREALAMAFPGRPQLAERWLATKLREFVADDPDQLTDEQYSAIVGELVDLARQQR